MLPLFGFKGQSMDGRKVNARAQLVLRYEIPFNETGIQSATITAPPGATWCSARAIGGGGQNGGGGSNLGGGGAAYARHDFAVRGDSVLSIFVGNAGNPGQASTVSHNETVVVSAAPGAQTTGGLATNCIGTIRRDGVDQLGVNQNGGPAPGDLGDYDAIGLNGPGNGAGSKIGFGSGSYGFSGQAGSKGRVVLEFWTEQPFGFT
jgi:hypothetical protein